jgi:hypothetical protein
VKVEPLLTQGRGCEHMGPEWCVKGTSHFVGAKAILAAKNIFHLGVGKGHRRMTPEQEALGARLVNARAAFVQAKYFWQVARSDSEGT